jgi:hypothetical protein
LEVSCPLSFPRKFSLFNLGSIPAKNYYSKKSPSFNCFFMVKEALIDLKILVACFDSSRLIRMSLFLRPIYEVQTWKFFFTN